MLVRQSKWLCSKTHHPSSWLFLIIVKLGMWTTILCYYCSMATISDVSINFWYQIRWLTFQIGILISWLHLVPFFIPWEINDINKILWMDLTHNCNWVIYILLCTIFWGDSEFYNSISKYSMDLTKKENVLIYIYIL